VPSLAFVVAEELLAVVASEQEGEVGQVGAPHMVPTVRYLRWARQAKRVPEG
jgi:hypothetical protein